MRNPVTRRESLIDSLKAVGFVTGKYPITVICGSMRFWKEMLECAENLTLNGEMVLMPFVTGAVGTDKVMLDEMHFDKIRLADTVVVVSGDEDYIGESTEREIAFAEQNSIPVAYWNREL